MDLRTERSHIQRKGYEWYQENLGEAVVWFEYDAVHSLQHNVYDEPTEDAVRAWKQPIIVPTLWLIYSEEDQRNEDQARLVTPTLRLAVPLQTLRQVGLSAPDDSARHLRDILVYNRTYWDVQSYNRRGRMRNGGLIVGINCTKIYPDDDMPFDVLPTIEGLADTTRPRGFPTDGYPNQVFPEHELPAHHAPVLVSFTDDFARADGPIGADYVTPPEDQISDQVDAIDFAIVSGGLECADDPNPNPNHLFGQARCLTAIPGDQQITLTVSNLDDCGFSGTIEIYAHMTGTDAACRVASWSTFDPPPASVYDYDSAGVTSADLSGLLDPASSLATTTTLRFVSRLSGEWEIWTNGAMVDSGTTPGVSTGEYVGFGLRWYQSGADSSPRIEAFAAEQLA